MIVYDSISEDESTAVCRESRSVHTSDISTFTSRSCCVRSARLPGCRLSVLAMISADANTYKQEQYGLLGFKDV
jgi:hypothetical protein